MQTRIQGIQGSAFLQCLQGAWCQGGRHVTPWTVPPPKWSPWTVHGRIIGPPGPNIAAIPGPPLLPTVPPAADCGLFAIAFATALAYGEQPGRCLLYIIRSKQGEATSAEVCRMGR